MICENTQGRNSDGNSGCYRVLSNWDSRGHSSHSIDGIHPDKMFDSEPHANVLFYLDEAALDAPRDSSRYLAHTLSDDSYFRVALTTEKNPELAKNADVVFVRFDPPIDDGFLDGLREYDCSKLFVNSVEGIEYFSNKKYLSDIAGESPNLLPNSQHISDNPRDLAKFMYDEQGTFVLKPVHGFGGEGIEKVSVGRKSVNALEKICRKSVSGCQDGVIAQRFIDGVEKYGDKRIHVVNGNVVGAVLRLPDSRNPEEFRCNVKKGGGYVRTEVTEEDYKILNSIIPLIHDKGVFWAGIDIIGPYLGEINAVSPGLLYGVDEMNGQLYSRGGAAGQFREELKEEISTRVCV